MKLTNLLKLSILLTVFIQLGHLRQLQAQVIQIGDGTSAPANTLYAPIYRFSATSTTTHNRSNIVYTSTELSAAGIFPGSIITQLAFNKLNAANFTSPITYSIYMGSTATMPPLSTSTTWASILASHTMVFSSTTFNVPNTAGWVTIDLTTPFTYTGGSIEIAFEQIMGASGGATANIAWEYTPGFATSIIGAWNSGSFPTTLNGTVAGYKERPNIRFTVVPSAPNNLAMSELVSPVNFCAGSNNIIVKVGNFGTNTVDSFRVNWSMDGVLQPTVFVTTPIASAGGFSNVTLGAHTFTSTPVELKAWTSHPNGVDDTYPANDTIEISLVPSLSGTYTINSATPTGGTNFASIADFTNALDAYGICGPVVANIVAGAGPYNEFVEFKNIVGASATNTITLNGNGETVQFNNTSTDRHLLIMNGAKYVTINNVNFKALNATYGMGAVLYNGAAYDSIKYSTFDLSAVTSTSSANSNGIVFSNSLTSATTTGGNANNNYIGHNTITGPVGSGGYYYGISLNTGNDNNVIEYNEIANFYYYGLYINGGLNNTFIGNDIHRKTKTTSTTFYGIYTTGTIDGNVITKNKIHSPQVDGMTTTNSNYYLYMFGDGSATNPVIVSNNIIYNNNRGGIVYGIYGSTVLNNKILHNTVNIDKAVGSTSAIYAVYLTGTNTGTFFDNNLINVSSGTNGTKYGVYYGSTAFADSARRNMVYVNTTGVSGTSYWGYLSSTFNTLDDFRTAYPMHEVGSVSVDPMILGAATGDLSPINTILADIGLDRLAIEDEDILGNARDNTPTPGAYEIEALSNDISAFELLSPLDYCAGSQTVAAKVINMGTNTISTYRVNWSINGTVQPYVTVTTPLAPAGTTGSEYDVTLGTYTFTSAAAEIKIWTSHPNDAVDANPTNDTITEVKTPAMSGTYTINSGAAASATNFVSIKAFTDSLESKGVCGPVVANIVAGSGPYNEFVMFNNISGTSEMNTITLNGNGVTVQYNNDATNRHLLFMNGARYVTVKDINFKALGTTYGYGAILTNTSYKDSIIDCTFDLSTVTTTSSANSSGIVLSSSATSATSTGSPAAVASYIGGNTLIGPTTNNGYYYGIVIAGTNSDSNVIENNEVANFYYYGIYVNGGKNNKIIGNNVHRATKTTTATFYGIYTTGTTLNTIVDKNRIHSPNSSTAASSITFYGLMIYGDGTPTEPVIVSNNLVYNINNLSSSYGIYLSGTLYNKVFHNTVNFDNSTTGSITWYGIACYGTNTGTDIYNNIFNIVGTGNGNKYGAYYASSTAYNDLQRNNIYVNAAGTGTAVYAYNSTNYTTMADFQAAFPSLELGSTEVNPNFVAAATGNLEPLNPALAYNGLDVLTYVSDDINGTARTLAPTVGAYQRPALNNNAGVHKVVNPVEFCTGTHDIVVRVQNYGANTITSVTLNWSLNGVLQTPIPVTATLAPVTSTTAPSFVDVTLTSYTFTTDAVNVVAWTSNPNGVADAFPSNDTLEAIFKASMSGYYTINQAAPTAGMNYNTMDEFMNDLNEYGVCGPVTAEVIEGSGPYEGVMYFGNIAGASDVNKIRIFGHGDTIKYTNTADKRQMLVFNNTSYVTVENLVFKTLAGDYGWGALITNGSHNDSIKNCYFDLTTTSSSSSVNTNGITISGSSTSPTTSGNNGRHIYIGGNTVQGPETGGMYYGLTVYGSTTFNNDSNVIENNKILDFYYYGMYFYSANYQTIRNNEIARPNKSGAVAFYGLYMNDMMRGSLVEGNRIHSGQKTEGGTSTFYGIYTFADGTATEPIHYINNAVYNPMQGGTIYMLYGSTVLYNEYYHNSFVINNELTGTSTNYGVYFTGTNTGSEFKNNLVDISNGTGGTKYGVYYSSAASLLNPQRNMIYVNAPSGTNYYAYRAANYATLAAFQTAFSTLEVGSISVNPQMADPMSGAVMPTNTAIEGTALDMTTMVPTDILGATRSIPPTPGCWEIDLSQLNDAGMVAVVYPVEVFCEGEHEVKVIVKNFGLNGLHTVNINYTVGTTSGTIVHDEYVPGFLVEPNNIDTISLGTYYFTNGVDMPIHVYTSAPNGTTDINTANDTIRDTLTASYRMAVNIGNDTSICNTHTITLDAGIADAEYLWNTGATTQTIDVNEAGTYHVRVKTQDGCVGYDTMELSHIVIEIGLPEVDTLCFGESLTLDAGNPGSTYFWSTGESTQTINVGNDGTYTVVVTSPQGCVEYDTVRVVFFGYAPSMAGINVTNLAPTTFKFEASLPENIIGYEWDFGDGIGTSFAASPTYEYTEPGTYLVTCTVYSECGSKVYTTYVTIFTSVDDVDQVTKDVVVYPNPAASIVNIEIKGEAVMQSVTIINALGQELKSVPMGQGVGKIGIDITSLPSGSYYLRIHTDKGTVNKPFQILK